MSSAMVDTANNLPLLTTCAGVALILLGVGWLVVASLLTPPGRHALSRSPKHVGWEGREGELKAFRASVIVERERSRHYLVGVS